MSAASDATTDVWQRPIDELDVISARLYGEQGSPHEASRRLRREAPVRFRMKPRA